MPEYTAITIRNKVGIGVIYSETKKLARISNLRIDFSSKLKPSRRIHLQIKLRLILLLLSISKGKAIMALVRKNIVQILVIV